MDCKEFERLIPDYIEKKMDFLTLRKFYGHMENCENCREELEIQFLVAEGMQRLEDGDAFDLDRELKGRLTETKYQMEFHNGFLRVGVVLQVIAVAGIAWTVLWILMG